MVATAQSRLYLEMPVQFLKGVGERRADLLKRLNIQTAGDLLFRGRELALAVPRAVPVGAGPGHFLAADLADPLAGAHQARHRDRVPQPQDHVLGRRRRSVEGLVSKLRD